MRAFSAISTWRSANRWIAGNHEGAWALRLYQKPFIRWIWLGGLFMMLGGFVAAGERRFRTQKARVEAGATVAEPTA